MGVPKVFRVILLRLLILTLPQITMEEQELVVVLYSRVLIPELGFIAARWGFTSLTSRSCRVVESH